MIENWIQLYPESVKVFDIDGNFPHHGACFYMPMNVIRLLAHIFPEAASKVGSYGATPLHCLCERPGERGVPLEVVELILDLFPKACKEIANGYTPLHLLLRRGSRSQAFVEMVLNCCPETLAMATNRFKNTQLHTVCRKVSYQVVRLLLKRGPFALLSSNGK
jgi:hypothetical protein